MRRCRSIPAAVESAPRFVLAGLGRHQCQRRRRHVGGVRHQEVDATAKALRQRLVQGPGKHQATYGGDVAGGAMHRSAVGVHRVQFRRSESAGDRDSHRTAPAAQVDHDRPAVGRRAGNGPLDQVLGAPARDEDAGIHRDPQAAEIDPAQDMLKRHARHAPVDHVLELRACAARCQQQAGFVRSKHTAGRHQPRGDGGD
jgi:hypothetical protein